MKKRLVYLIALFVLASPLAGIAQLDSSKWYVRDFPTSSNSMTFCWASSQATLFEGNLQETTIYGNGICPNPANYKTAEIMSSPFSFTYGTVKVRAKMPGLGTHATIWMWGGASNSSGYPPDCIAALKIGGRIGYDACATTSVSSQEVDVGEISPSLGLGWVGNNTHVWQNGAVVSSGGGWVNVGGDLSADYHIYELDWSPTTLTYKLDGVTTTTEPYVLNVPMFLIIDQWIDSSAPPEPPSFYPLTGLYDYVRVCSGVGVACNPGDADMIFEDEFGGGSFVQNGFMSGGVAQ